MRDRSVRQAELVDIAEIAAMCALLWTDGTEDEYRREIARLLKTKMCGPLPATVFVAQDAEGNITGFVQVGLRSHADGCDSEHPVGFLEGWFVKKQFRRQGIGKALVDAAEAWARSHGCREMASDTWIEETISLHAHEALGFEVVDRCITFRKPL
ncbi:GNAT family N-acetyltransferase [Edaphobacter flagellatus]|uniref:GNAT family N-acetyltransferase n=1 Tax=Edaphobacter flagellatus TaxID=1933044 RepID=UPI0021B49FE5|nr:GNAT family N-acetyltransferase [Edaphobacter flagellatus]